MTTLGGSAVEKKVPLPERWLKGFAEVQVASVADGPAPRADGDRGAALPAEPAADEVARGRVGDAGGRGAPALLARRRRRAVCLAGPERLRLLEKLLPFAKALRAYGPLPAARPRRGAERLGARARRRAGRVRLSPGALPRLLGRGRRPRRPRGRRRGRRRRGRRRPPRRARRSTSARLPTTGARAAGVQTALGALGAAGRVGYDLAPSAFFHRELPYDRAVLEKMHPRLLGARKLVEQGAVRLDGRRRRIVAQRRRRVPRPLRGRRRRCTCAWFAKHRGERGPCKHVLAVEHARRRPAWREPRRAARWPRPGDACATRSSAQEPERASARRSGRTRVRRSRWRGTGPAARNDWRRRRSRGSARRPRARSSPTSGGRVRAPARSGARGRLYAVLPHAAARSSRRSRASCAARAPGGWPLVRRRSARA